MSVYQLPREFEAIKMELMENGGELTPELEAQTDALTANAWDAFPILYRGRVNAKSELEACEGEVDRLKAVVRSKRSWLGFLDYTIKRLLSLVGQSKVNTPLGWIREQKNGQARWYLTVEAATELPEAFRRIVPATEEADWDAIKAHFVETGELPPGVGMERGTHVRHQPARKEQAA